MSRLWLAILLVPSLADADDLELGGFVGPRVFSDSSALGFIDAAPGHPMLQTSIELGVRVSHDFGLPWLFPEFELAMSPTHTNDLMVNGADVPAVRVFWMEPRVQLRIELRQKQRVLPFVFVGGGAPIALSSARMTFNSGITGDGYFGGGVRFDTGKFHFRVDARLAVLPGVDPVTYDNKLAFEGDLSLGIELAVRRTRAPVGETQVATGPPGDRDGDGIPDNVDQCPDRAEDKDGFQDADGCPDIDNDGDHVLDVADKCPTEPETYNGYQDDDGCPDTVPADVDGIRGAIEGLVYGEGETAVHDSAQASLAKIAKIMQAHPSIRILLIGHTDDRESKTFAAPQPGQPAQDLATIASDLSRGRAEAVRQMLSAAGVPAGRIVIDGVGAEEPVADNSTTKGRLANRRVEVKLYVAKP
jgi:outer membrane protein OmpA-like peptidoglycan-associated protein